VTTKEYGILFKPEMVQAILRDENPKTETRRLPDQRTGLNVQHYHSWLHNWALSEFIGMDGRHAVFEFQSDVDDSTEHRIRCPYGMKGDILWIREAWGLPDWLDGVKPRDVAKELLEEHVVYRRDHPSNAKIGKWRSPIHMPRAAARHLLEVEDTTLADIQDISEESVDAEGTYGESGLHFLNDCPYPTDDPNAVCHCGDYYPQEAFAMLWDSINAKRKPKYVSAIHPGQKVLGFDYASNPIVWVAKFRRIQP
jgi:hypothetical protein